MANLAEEAIQKSFVKLLTEKPFDKITVKEIIDDCQISRRTFYYHYRDLYAVVEALFREEAERALRDFQEQGSWEESFLLASRFLLENKSAVIHLFHSVHREELERYIDQLANEVMRRFLEHLCPGDAVSQEDKLLLGDFYKFGLAGIVREWLAGGMKAEPEAVIRRLGVLLEGNLAHSLGITSDKK